MNNLYVATILNDKKAITFSPFAFEDDQTKNIDFFDELKLKSFENDVECLKYLQFLRDLDQNNVVLVSFKRQENYTDIFQFYSTIELWSIFAIEFMDVILFNPNKIYERMMELNFSIELQTIINLCNIYDFDELDESDEPEEDSLIDQAEAISLLFYELTKK